MMMSKNHLYFQNLILLFVESGFFIDALLQVSLWHQEVQWWKADLKSSEEELSLLIFYRELIWDRTMPKSKKSYKL